ncbi:MAG: sulfur carrier protein ThiS [Dehalococcoidia bacterium]|nr:sulfur carrier protein ThiS [Dehalococcoidia bacterium]
MSGQRASTSVAISLNGERRTVAPGTTVADLVPSTWRRGVAVARNGEVVTRGEWSSTAVEPDDKLEIVRPIQGG